MHNKLSFMNSIFVLLLVGKIGHIGTLGAIPWLFVFLPLLGDLILDFITQLGYVNAHIARFRGWVEVRKIKAIVNKFNSRDNG